MHLRISLLIILTGLFFLQCKEEERPAKNLVKVGDSVLTEEYVNNALGEFHNQAKYRDEFINNWIEREVLFKEAGNTGILDDNNFSLILNRSRKELAAAMLINKYLDDNKYEPASEESKKFYEQYKEDFILPDDAYKINIAYFGNKEKAIQFRSILIESDWKKAINAFRGDGALLSNESDKLIYIYQLQPVILYKIINNLLPGEISIVHQAEPMSFVIVELIEKYYRGSTPAFEIVQDKVKDRIIVLKNKEVIRNYVNKLIDEHNIEIKRYNE
jgi:hypothetical protein